MIVRKTRLKIGILGCRGVPNHYGGFEQFAQFLSQGLVRRGRQVWVYQSSLHPYRKKEWEGVQLIRQFDPENHLGSFGQFIYDFNCLRDARKRNFDVLLQLGYTSSVIFFPIWPKKSVHIVHMDGQEWKRSKYNKAVRSFLKKMEKLAARQGDKLIADSQVIQTYLKEKYQKDAVYIPYGADIPSAFQTDALVRFGLKKRQYFLVVARFVPENNLHLILEGYSKSNHFFPLLIVGDPNNKYGKGLKARYAQEQIRFLGSIYDQKILNSLRHYASLYFHGHSVGGTNPSLLEAMACGATICAYDAPFNRAVLNQDAFYFKTIEELRLLFQNSNQQVYSVLWKEENFNKVKNNYAWNKIIDAYEALFIQEANEKTNKNKKK